MDCADSEGPEDWILRYSWREHIALTYYLEKKLLLDVVVNSGDCGENKSENAEDGE